MNLFIMVLTDSQQKLFLNGSIKHKNKNTIYYVTSLLLAE